LGTGSDKVKDGGALGALESSPAPCYKFCIHQILTTALWHFAYMWILWQQKQRKKHRKSTTCNAGNLLGPKFRQGKLYCK